MREGNDPFAGPEAQSGNDTSPFFPGCRPAPNALIHPDDREASMDQQPANSTQSHPVDTAAAPSGQAPALKLHTAGAANLAYLYQDGSGHAYLYFRGLHFDVDDYVPESLSGHRLMAPAGTAGQFVCRQMLTHYGYREDGWPELARRFLLQHLITKPGLQR
jgi:hypothetical protein